MPGDDEDPAWLKVAETSRKQVLLHRATDRRQQRYICQICDNLIDLSVAELFYYYYYYYLITLVVKIFAIIIIIVIVIVIVVVVVVVVVVNKFCMNEVVLFSAECAHLSEASHMHESYPVCCRGVTLGYLIYWLIRHLTTLSGNKRGLCCRCCYCRCSSFASWQLWRVVHRFVEVIQTKTSELTRTTPVLECTPVSWPHLTYCKPRNNIS